MDIIKEALQLKTTLCEAVAAYEKSVSILDKIIANLAAESTNLPQPITVPEYETVAYIRKPLSFYKGKKPTGVVLPDGERKNVTTWKKLVTELLKDCMKDAERKKALLKLRGLVAGRDRTFIAATDENMRSPVKIDEYLYVECHYDTETLLHIVLERILKSAGYDYDSVKIALKND